MISTSVNTVLGEKHEILWIDVTVTDTISGELLREIRLEEGSKVKVDPINPSKMKHKDREGVFVGVSYDGKRHIEAAKIKFDDTKRVGKAEFSDLIELTK